MRSRNRPETPVRITDAPREGRPTGRRALLIAGAVGAALLPPLLGACAALPPGDMIPPRVSVIDVSFDQMGLTEIALTVTIDVENPNVYELPLTDLRADLELLGRPIGSGWSREVSSAVPAKGRRTVPMAFTVPTARLLDLVRAFRQADGQRVGYRVAGSARWGDGGRRVPFERTGDLQAWGRVLDGLGPLPR